MAFVSMPVVSTAIASLQYDDESGTLQVTFHKGGSYLLKDVPAIEANRFAGAMSPGSYWNANMKGKY